MARNRGRAGQWQAAPRPPRQQAPTATEPLLVEVVTPPTAAEPARVAAPEPARAPRDSLVATVLGLAVFAFYAASTATGPVTGDNPEYVGVAVELGVHHAPGYPLAAIIGHLFSLLPLPVTYAVNLSAAACGGATVAVLYLTARRLSVPRLAAVAAGLLFATTALIWSFFIQIEAFPFFNLTTSLIVWALVRWKQQPAQLQRLVLAAGFFGLGMCSHQNTSLLVPAILVVVWSERTIVLRRRGVIVAALAMAFAGWLVPYLYEFWAAARHPVHNWGAVSSIDDLISMLRRSSYTDTSFGFGRLDTAPERLWMFVRSFQAVALLVPVGVYAAWRRHRWYGQFLVVGLVTFALAMILLDGVIATFGYFVLSRFFMIWHVVLAPAVGLGLAWITERLARWRPTWGRAARLGVPAAAVCVALLAATAYPSINQRGREITANYSADVFAGIKPGGVLLITGDEASMPANYQQVVNKVRPDVTLIVTPLLVVQWYVDELRARYPKLKLTHPVYVQGYGTLRQLLDDNSDKQFYVIGTYHLNGILDDSLEGHYYVASQGLTYEMRPQATDTDVYQLAKENEAIYAKLHPPAYTDIRGGDQSFEPIILAHYVEPLMFIADAFDKGGARDQALRWYQKVIDINPFYLAARQRMLVLTGTTVGAPVPSTGPTSTP